MRYLISVLLIYVLALSSAFGNLPPTTLKGQADTAKSTNFNFEVPNYQYVKTATNTGLINTGSSNELQNPNFEHSTVTTGWITSNATPTAETSNMFEGKKSLSLALTGALSLSQSSTINAARKSGVQMVASLWVKSDDVSDLQLCSLKNGAEDKCTSVGGYVQGSGWRQLTVSFLGDATSNGIKLKSTDTTGTVLVDQAFVGVGSPIVDFTPDMVYSAKVSSAGTISDENTDWLSGTTCSISDTSLFTCTFTNQVFTVAPNCSVVHTYGPASDTSISYISSVSSTQVVIRTGYTTNSSSITKNNYPFQLICQKQGADYKTSKAYVASSSDFGYTNAGAITITATTTNPTKGAVVTDRVWASRDGQRLIAEYQFTQSTGGSAGSGDYLFSLPNGLSFDSSVVGFYTGSGVNDPNIAKSVVGYALPQDSSVVTTTGVLVAYNSTRFRVLSMWGGTSKGFVSSTFFNLGIAIGYSLRLNTPIAGWQDSSVIVGSFQGYNETPGTSRVETFSFSYGSTNAFTVCSASPCSYLDQIGNAVTSVTRSGAGTYTMNLSKTYSKLKCNVNARSTALLIGGPIRCENCSSIIFATDNTGGSSADSYGTLVCQAIP